MKKIFTKLSTLFISSVFIASSFAAPFQVNAQFGGTEAIFEPYQAIIEGGLSAGVDGLAACAEDAVVGFLEEVLPDLFSELLGSLFDQIFGGFSDVPVDESGLKEIQKQATQTQKEDAAKETCLDTLASAVSQQLIQELENQTLEMINNLAGDGVSLLVQNLDQHLRDTAERAFREYITTSSILSSTCEYFRNDVLLSIELGFVAQNPGQPSFIDNSPFDITSLDFGDEECLLDIVTEGKAEAFITGDPAAFSWDAWFVSFNDPGSNPSLAVEQASNELKKKVNDNAQKEMEKLGWSEGIMGITACDTEAGYTKTPDGLCHNSTTDDLVQAKVITPGTAVRATIEEMIASDLRRLEIADELSEILANLGQTLIGRMFGDGGLTSVGEENPINIISGGGLTIDDFNQGGGYTGSDPLGYLFGQVQIQTEIENRVVTALRDIRRFFNQDSAQNLIENLNQCPYVTNNPELNQQVLDFQSIPQIAAQPVNNGDDPEIGPQKVDWAGNDFNWVEGRRYGFTGECVEEIYSRWFYDDPDDPKINLNAFVPEYAFYIQRVSDGQGGTTYKWRVSQCVPYVFPNSWKTAGAGWWDVTNAAGEQYMPDAYRPARNNVTYIDWEGYPFEWERLDIYGNPPDGDNRYGFDRCDQLTAGSTSYHVTAYGRRSMPWLESGNGLHMGRVYFNPQGRGDLEWRESICRPNGNPPGWRLQGRDVFNAPSFFQNQTFNEIGQRITRTNNLLTALQDLRNQMDPDGDGTPTGTEAQVEEWFRVFNDLRIEYTFDTRSEATRLERLAGSMEPTRIELEEIAVQYCNYSS